MWRLQYGEGEKLKITRLNTILKQTCSDDGRLGWKWERGGVEVELSVGLDFVTFMYRYASFNDGDTFWEMYRYAISSLCERHRVYLHKRR